MRIIRYLLSIVALLFKGRVSHENLLAIILVSFFVSNCSSNRTSSSHDVGFLIGTVVLSEENQMPNNQVSRAPKGVRKEILIFELTNVSETQASGKLYSSINSKLLKTTKTNAEGEFKVKLTEGKYSVVVKENDGYYINLFDKDNNIHPVMIEGNKTTTTTVTISYNASY